MDGETPRLQKRKRRRSTAQRPGGMILLSFPSRTKGAGRLKAPNRSPPFQRSSIENNVTPRKAPRAASPIPVFRSPAAQALEAPSGWLTADSKPQTGPSAGRADVSGPAGPEQLGKLLRRGPPALPVNLR